MMTRTRTRLCSLLLIAVMLFTGPLVEAAQAAQGRTDTKAASAPVEITDYQLFQMYPEFLSPQLEADIINHYSDLYCEFIDDHSENTGLRAYAEGLRNGASIIAGEVLSWMNWGPSYAEKIQRQALDVVKDALFGSEKTTSKEAIIVSGAYQTIKGIHNVYDEVERRNLATEMAGCALDLTEKEINDIVSEAGKSGGVLSGLVSDGVAAGRVLQTCIMLYEMELDSVTKLAQQLPEHSALRAHLWALREDIHKNVVLNFTEQYLKDKVISKVIGAASQHLPSPIALGKLAFDVMYDHGAFGVTAPEIAVLTYLNAYEMELRQVATDRRSFWEKKQNGQPLKEKEVDQYELLYAQWTAVMETNLKYARKVDPKYNKAYILDMWIPVYEMYGTQPYLEACRRDVQAAIDNGSVKPPKEVVDKNTSNVKPEESRASIQEKFRQIQAKYPPNQGVAFNGSYGGCTECYGFARMVFNKMFGVDMPAAYRNTKRYAYANSSNVVLVGQLAGSAAVTEASVRQLLSQAQTGDIIQACGHSQHTMVVVTADDTGIVVYDANSRGDNIIRQYKKTYAEMAALYSQKHSVSESGMSLYHAANYDTLYWDGTAVFYDDSINFVVEYGTLKAYHGFQRHIVIPEGVTEIADGVFSGKNIETVVCPTTLELIGDSAFANCRSLYYVEFNSDVRQLGAKAFMNCSSLSGIRLPNLIQTIGTSTFENCTSLNRVVFPADLITIGTNAFYNCASLRKVDLPDYMETIGYRAFDKSGLRSLVIPDYVETIDGYAFRNCTYLDSVKLPKWLKTLDRGSFTGTRLTEIEIPASLETAGSGDYDSTAGAFEDLATLKSVTFETGATRVAKYLFDGCPGIESITIPEGISTVGYSAFENCVNLKTIEFPASLKTIESNAFSFCTALKSVELPANLTKIGYRAFKDCRFVELTVPDSATEIQNYAFYNCRELQVVKLGKGLKTLGRGAFSKTKLTEIEIPASLEIGGDSDYDSSGGAFEDLTTLKRVTFAPGTTLIARHLFDGCIGLTEIVLPEGITLIDYSAFENCSGLRTISLPSSLKTIESEAFSFCTALKSIELPENLTKIGYRAFKGCGFVELRVPDSMTEIQNYAFYNCRKLNVVKLGKGLKTLGRGVFSETKLTEIEIPASLEIGGDTSSSDDSSGGAFEDLTTLKKVTFAPGTTLIARHLFDGCIGLTEIVLPEGITLIDYSAFENCSGLRTISLPSSLKTIESEAFSFCTALNSIELPENLTKIGYRAFKNCGFVELRVPDSVTEIQNYAFYNCRELNAVKLGKSLKTLGRGVFSETKLTEIEIPASLKFAGDSDYNSSGGAFEDLTTLKKVTFAPGATCVATYLFDGCTGLTEIVIPEGISVIGGSAFKECSGLGTISLPSSLKTIESDAFSFCTALNSIELPENLTQIGYRAFKNCGFVELRVPDSVTEIQNYAFYNCRELNVVKLGKGLKTLGRGVFRETKLTEIEIPASLKFAGDSDYNSSGGAFEDLTTLKKVTFAPGVTCVATYLFNGCTGIEEIVLPEGISIIDFSAFEDCSALRTVTLPRSLQSIKNDAFESCPELTKLTFRGGAPAIGSSAFRADKLTAYYPQDNTTWTDEAKQNYGGTVTWTPYVYQLTPADLVVDQIVALGKITLESETAIKDARAAYEALTPAQQAQVTNLAVLEAAEAELARLQEQAGADLVAAKAVESKINALGKITLESENAIKSARAAYEALTPAQQKLVTNLSVLEAAEARLKELQQGTADQEAARAVEDQISALGQITLESERAIKSARAAYNDLTPAQKKLVSNLSVLEAAERKLAELQQGTADQEAARAVEDQISALGQITLESESAIKSARAAYNDLTPAQKKLVSNLSVLEAAERKLAELQQGTADQEAARAVEDQISALGQITLESERAIKSARAAYNNLTPTQKKLVSNLSVLEAAERKLAELQQGTADQEAARAVEEQISALGQITLESESAIKSARAAYNDLTPAQKKLVSNLSVLEAAERRLAELQQGDADFAAAKSVEEKIAALGTITLESERAIKSARAAYNALTPTQQKLVRNLHVLEEAEQQLVILKKDAEDRAAAEAVDAQIEAIGEVTGHSETAIRQARQAYNALTDTQKALVTKLNVLLAAEEQLLEALVPMVEAELDAQTGKPFLYWNEVGGAVKYEVWCRVGTDGKFEKIATTTRTSMIHTEAESDNTYAYQVRAITDAGTAGHFSDAVIVRMESDVLPAPTLTVTNRASTGKPYLKWTPVDGAAKYEIYRSTSREGTFTRLTATSETGIQNGSTTAGKTYYYKVRAIAADGMEGEFSAVKSRTCDLPQPKLTVTLRSGKPYLSWEAVSGAVKYEVYRSVNGGEFARFYTTSGTHLTNGSASAGNTYAYQVRAICSNKYGNSAFSEPQQVTLEAVELGVPTLTVTNKSSTGKPYLKWTAVDGAEKYEIYRATSKSGTYTRLTTTGGTRLTNGSATAGKTYYYKVRAIAADGTVGDFSAIKTRTCDLARPDVKLSTRNGHPYLYWKSVSGAVRYEVYCSVDGGSFTRLLSVKGTKLTHSSAKSGHTYRYRVKAIASKSSANSAYSYYDTITVK